MKNALISLILITTTLLSGIGLSNTKTSHNSEIIKITISTPAQNDVIEFSIYEDPTACIVWGHDSVGLHQREISYVMNNAKIDLSPEAFSSIRQNIQVIDQSVPAERYPKAKDAWFVQAIRNEKVYKYQYGVETIPEPTTLIIDEIIDASGLPDEDFPFLYGV